MPSKKMSRHVKNVFWSLSGQVLPLLVAIAVIPILIKSLGLDRFGVLTLVWMTIGYFALFDLGMGRALTKLVAERVSHSSEQDVFDLTWTALTLMLGIGIVAGFAWYAVSPWLIYDIFSMPSELQAEAETAFAIVALTIPAVTVTAGLKGFLEAKQRFRLIAVINVAVGMLTFSGPLAVAYFSPDLGAVTVVLAIVRLLATSLFFVAVMHDSPMLTSHIKITTASFKELVGYGGWITVTNIVGPVMTYLDRFFVGGLLSVATVAYYSTPYDVITKVLFIPAAICAVLFPVFAARFVSDRPSATKLHAQGIKFTWLVLFPISLVAITFSYELLGLWVGEQFAINSGGVLQWLALGIFVNGIAHVPYTLIQAFGRPDLTAKIHIIELPAYLIAVWLLTANLGVEGTAIAWVGRALVDAIVLLVFSGRIIEYSTAVTWQVVGFPALAACGLLALLLVDDFLLRKLFFIAGIITFVVVSWRYVLSESERFLLCNPRRIFALTDSR